MIDNEKIEQEQKPDTEADNDVVASEQDKKAEESSSSGDATVTSEADTKEADTKEADTKEADTKEVTAPENKKKISKMDLNEVEATLQRTEKHMAGLTSKYAQSLLARKKCLENISA